MSIKTKLLIFALSISLIPVSITTTLYYFNAKSTIKRQALDWLTAVAESRKIHTISFLDGKKGRVVDFSSDGFIRDSLETISLRGILSHAVSDLNRHLKVNKKPLDRHITAIAVLDINGNVVASTNELWIGKDMSEDNIFMSCVSKNYGETYTGKSYNIPYLDENCIFISAPVTGKLDNKTIGVIVNAYDIAILNEITTKRAGMGESGEVYIVNRDKKMITESRFIENAVFNQVVDTEPVRRIIEGDNGGMAGIYPDYRGVSIVGASTDMPEYGWILLVEVNKAEAFASIMRLRIYSIIMGIVSAIVIVTIAIILAGRISKPIQKLIKRTQRIAKGDLSFEMVTESRDEIGYLADSFNIMASQLRDARNKLQDYAHNLEEKVEDKTKEIKHMLDELTYKNKEMEQIIYVTSHDLRSPLLNIQGFSMELKKSLEQMRTILNDRDISAEIREKFADPLEEDIPDALRFILASSSKMDTLLSGLLRLSRMGRMSLDIKQMDMNRLIYNVVDTNEYKIKEAKIKVQIDELPSCRGDNVQINQVFSNLLDNALKYLDSDREGVIRISGRKETGHIVYCMEDNGIGIAERHQDKVFEVFHRLNPGDSIAGEGLGLTIVSWILNRHGGKIWVESEPGKGSKFFVSLPA